MTVLVILLTCVNVALMARIHARHMTGRAEDRRSNQRGSESSVSP